MANLEKWGEISTPQTYLSTELNSLADGGRKLGGEIDNADSNNRFTFAILDLYIYTQGAARDSNAFVSVHCIKSVDGTNFEYGGDALAPPPSSWVTNFTLDAVANDRRVVVEVPIPPCKFKLLLTNETGQAFASTDNVLKYGLYCREIV